MQLRNNLLLAALIAVLALLASSPTLSMPAHPQSYVVNQPDGMAITLTLRGDEYFHWNEDPTGFPVVQDSISRNWVYAQEADGELVPTKHIVGRVDPNAVALAKPDLAAVATARVAMGIQRVQGEVPFRASTKGNLKNLVVLVAFSDLAVDYTNQQFDDLMNKIGYTDDGAVGSVNDFFAEASRNQIQFQSIIAGPVTLSKGFAYYGADSAGNDIRPRQMVSEALQLLETSGFDFTTVDGDGDGWVDDLTIIHAGGGQEYGGNNSNYIWSHYWSLASPVTYDGIQLQPYHTEPARRGWDSDPSSQGITRIGVICHESGHFLGLPDLYDYGYDSSGAGEFCLMAGGSWGGGDGKRPVHPSAWCKKDLDWITPTNLDVAGQYTLRQIATTGECAKLQGEFPPTQYFLIENRQGVGFDQSLPGTNRGLLIWHVDETVPNNNNQSHYLVDLEEASGTQHLQSGANSGQDSDYYRQGNATSFTESTNPNSNSYSDEEVGQGIENISATGSTMRFDVTGGSATVAKPQFSVPEGTYSELFQVAITCSTPETYITYTLDGSAPTATGTLYTDPIYIRRTSTLKAIAYKTAAEFSRMATAEYGLRKSVGTGTSKWAIPLDTGYQRARTQCIFLAGELGTPCRIIGCALDVRTAPSQVLNNFHIRMKHTPLTYFQTMIWESDWASDGGLDWTISSTGWQSAFLNEPFDYDGSSNLMVDLSFNNTTATFSGEVNCTNLAQTRTMFYRTNNYTVDPPTWSGLVPSATRDTYRPNVAFDIEFPPLTAPVMNALPLYSRGTVSPALSWSPVPGATQYQCQMSENSNFAPFQESAWLSPGGSPVFESLVSGKAYYYRTRCRSAYEESPWSEAVSSIQDAVPPQSSVNSIASPQSGSFSVAWTASDALSGIARVDVYYSFNGGAYTLFGGGTSASGSITFTAPAGAGTYRLYTRATDVAGNVEAAPGTPDQTVVVEDGSLAMLKAKANGASVSFIAKPVTAVFADHFYVEEPDRTCGLRVDKASHGFSVGWLVNVSGTMATNSRGERYISATTATRNGTNTSVVKPLAVPCGSLGGLNWKYNQSTGAGQKGTTLGRGLNTLGLLVKTFGRVTQKGTGWFIISDGNPVTEYPGYPGVYVEASGYTLPAVGDYVGVTGISSCDVYQTKTVNRLRIRAAADILYYQPVPPPPPGP